MDRTVEDMLRQGMLVVCENRPGYYHVTWPRSIEMKTEEAEVETAVGKVGDVAVEAELK